VGSDDFNLYALNADGTLKWLFGTEGFVRSSLLIGTDGTGTSQWTVTTGGAVTSSPAMDKTGRILIGSNDGIFYTIK